MKIIDTTTKVYNKGKIAFFSIVAVGVAGAIAIPMVFMKKMPEVPVVEPIDTAEVQDEIIEDGPNQDIREFDIDALVNSKVADENGNMVYEEITFDPNDQKSIDAAYEAEMKRMKQDPLYYNPNGLPKVESVYESTNGLTTAYNNLLDYCSRPVPGATEAINGPVGIIRYCIEDLGISLNKQDEEKMRIENKKAFEGIAKRTNIKVNEKWIENEIRNRLTSTRNLISKYAETATGYNKQSIDLVIACGKTPTRDVSFQEMRMFPATYCGAVAKWAFDDGNYELDFNTIECTDAEKVESYYDPVVYQGIYNFNLDNINVGFCVFSNEWESDDMTICANIDGYFMDICVGMGINNTNKRFGCSDFAAHTIDF